MFLIGASGSCPTEKVNLWSLASSPEKPESLCIKNCWISLLGSEILKAIGKSLSTVACCQSGGHPPQYWLFWRFRWTLTRHWISYLKDGSQSLFYSYLRKYHSKADSTTTSKMKQRWSAASNWSSTQTPASRVLAPTPRVHQIVLQLAGVESRHRRSKWVGQPD